MDLIDHLEDDAEIFVKDKSILTDEETKVPITCVMIKHNKDAGKSNTEITLS